ncbi:endothelin-converting enzyme 1-like isoform X2 [Centruroides sculpturatus]|uniref:endothelin-converting enzyme 1-like isoform X1 n=1 Tax=Centruroides sculpturatus TaxID=218467 RepID=UPI000C6D529A|nr:endothelin-converting enzyme 1-like isoform X1 [Centruroides sculpturatus]XP_023217455.1 endothelin-converting enzyme 1-like isoform X2 [Centruroides sculpturatus]
MLDMEKTKYNGGEKEVKKRNFTIWTRRSLLEKILLVAVAALFLILIIIIIVSLHSLLDNRNKTPKVCTSQACIKQTAFLYDNLDLTSKPCQDFYQFACGSYKNHHSLRDENSLHNSLDDIQDGIFLSIKNLLETPEETEDPNLKLAKKFYYSCINKRFDSTRDEVVKLIRNSGLGDWPISDPGRNPNFNVKLGVLSAHGRNPFFETTIGNQSSEIVISLYPSDEKMTQLKEDYYFNSSITNPSLQMDEKSIYHKFIFNSLVQMGVQPDAARKDAADLIDFETSLANITKQVLDSTKEDITLSKMEEEFPGLSWQNWFQTTFGYKINIKEDGEKVVFKVLQPQRLKRIFQLIKSVKESVVDNYMMWRFVVDLLPLLDTGFRRSYKTMLPIVKDDSNFMYRKREYFFDEWKQCVHITSEVFRLPITLAIASNSIRPAMKTEVEDLAGHLKEVFKQMVTSQNWLDKDSKMFLRSKMENMNIEIVNNKTMQDPIFTFIMKQLEIEDDTFVNALLQVERAFFKLTATPSHVKRSKPPSVFIKYPPLSPTIAYSIPINTLVLSVGMLLTDINYSESPKSLIYGGLGSNLAKNMYAAYHEHLYQESKEISDEDVISKRDEYRYKEKMNCFRAQQLMYSTYFNVEKNPNKMATTLKEVISYTVGLKAAYYAYMNYIKKHEQKDAILPEIYSNLTHEQLLFVRFAQTMCEIQDKKNPRQNTVMLNEILYNIEEFSRAFKCPSESTMNPNDKCAIWE